MKLGTHIHVLFNDHITIIKVSIEVIVTYMYNSDDATMQTITIVNSHYITEGQYVAIIACIIIICTRTKPATLVIF